MTGSFLTLHYPFLTNCNGLQATIVSNWRQNLDFQRSSPVLFQ